MKKSLLEIYALLVCFFTVVCFVITLGFAGFSLVRIARPDFSVSSNTFKQYQSNDAYWGVLDNSSYYRKDTATTRPDEEMLTMMRNEGYAIALKAEAHEGAKTLVNCLIVLLINAVTFGVHWLIAKRARGSVV